MGKCALGKFLAVILSGFGVGLMSLFWVRKFLTAENAEDVEKRVF